jgi:hypothetical protein
MLFLCGIPKLHILLFFQCAYHLFFFYQQRQVIAVTITQRWVVRKQVPQIINRQFCGYIKFDYLPKLWPFSDLLFADSILFCEVRIRDLRAQFFQVFT